MGLLCENRAGTRPGSLIPDTALETGTCGSASQGFGRRMIQMNGHPVGALTERVRLLTYGRGVVP